MLIEKVSGQVIPFHLPTYFFNQLVLKKTLIYCGISVKRTHGIRNYDKMYLIFTEHLTHY